MDHEGGDSIESDRSYRHRIGDPSALQKAALQRHRSHLRWRSDCREILDMP
jgi:hypothetical protein